MENSNESPLFEQEVLLATGEVLSKDEAAAKALGPHLDGVTEKIAMHVAGRIRSAASSFLADSTGPTDEHADMLLTWLGSGMRARRERENGRPGSA